MQKHTKNYYKGMGVYPGDFIACEIPGCDSEITDCHHVNGRRFKGADEFSNLCGLCRRHHEAAHKLRKPYITKEELEEITQNR